MSVAQASVSFLTASGKSTSCISESPKPSCCMHEGFCLSMNDSPPLFRPEVLAGQRQNWLGAITLIRPVSLGVLTAFVVLVALAIGAYFCIGQYTHKARIIGHLVPDQGVVRLLSPLAATVLERHALEGQVVKEGDVLFVLSLERTTLSGDTQVAVQTSLATRERSLRDAQTQKTQLEQTQAQAIDRQLANLRREQTQIVQQAQLQRERLVLAQQTQARYEDLRQENFVSEAQVQTKAEEVLGLRAQLQAVERQQAVQQREMSQLEAQRRELPLQGQARQGEIARELATLAQASAENEALRRIVVRAPHSGTLTAVLASTGQSVSPNLPLASLVPTGAVLQAHLFAPSSAMGFVRTGQDVLLRYQAYPYQKFGHQAGRVTQVSRTPLHSVELSGLAVTKTDEPLYRITVALDRQEVLAYGMPQALSPGMQLEADVLLDRRRLIEWIFEPVLSITGRI
jgi:membrane fusion protein